MSVFLQTYCRNSSCFHIHTGFACKIFFLLASPPFRILLFAVGEANWARAGLLCAQLPRVLFPGNAIAESPSPPPFRLDERLPRARQTGDGRPVRESGLLAPFRPLRRAERRLRLARRGDRGANGCHSVGRSSATAPSPAPCVGQWISGRCDGWPLCVPESE